MLLRYFKKTPLNQLSGLCLISEFVLAPAGDEPNLPLKVLRARLDRADQIVNCGMLVTEALIGLRGLNVNFPAQLAVNVDEHKPKDVVKGLILNLIGASCLFIEAQILEPEGTILLVKLETLLA